MTRQPVPPSVAVLAGQLRLAAQALAVAAEMLGDALLRDHPGLLDSWVAGERVVRGAGPMVEDLRTVADRLEDPSRLARRRMERGGNAD